MDGCGVDISGGKRLLADEQKENWREKRVKVKFIDEVTKSREIIQRLWSGPKGIDKLGITNMGQDTLASKCCDEILTIPGTSDIHSCSPSARVRLLVRRIQRHMPFTAAMVDALLRDLSLDDLLQVFTVCSLLPTPTITAATVCTAAAAGVSCNARAQRATAGRDPLLSAGNRVAGTARS